MLYAESMFSHIINTKQIIGVPYDMPVVGYGGKTVNYLRLFAAKSSNTLDIELFNKGGYVNAVEDNIKVETISKGFPKLLKKAREGG